MTPTRPPPPTHAHSNTKAHYDSRHKDWRAWCATRPEIAAGPYPELVTGAKLILFLKAQEEITSRQAGREGQIRGIRTYEAYVSAMVDLWSKQVGGWVGA